MYAKALAPPVVRDRPRTRAVAAVVLTAAALALSARAAVPIGPVPITFQTLIVLVAPALLGRARATAAVATYLAAGTAGLPVFANPLGLAGPTGGYLIGFALAAWVVGTLAEAGWTRSLWRTPAALLIGTGVIFAAGLAHLAWFVPLDRLVAVGLIPFVPGAVLKTALAAVIIRSAR